MGPARSGPDTRPGRPPPPRTRPRRRHRTGARRCRHPFGPWDLVLLDVDNGPSFLVHAGNERIYSPEALRGALDQVSPGGTLAIWAAQPEPDLLAALSTLAPTEEVLLEVEREGRTLTYALYLTRP